MARAGTLARALHNVWVDQTRDVLSLAIHHSRIMRRARGQAGTREILYIWPLLPTTMKAGWGRASKRSRCRLCQQRNLNVRQQQDLCYQTGRGEGKRDLILQDRCQVKR